MSGLRRSLSLAVPFSLVALACSNGGSPPPQRDVNLDQAVVSRVGSQDIAVQTVERIAAAQGLSVQAAVAVAVEDALLAEHARAALAANMPLAHIERLAFSRQLLNQIDADSRAQGPANDEELQRESERRWVEVDRPEMFRTTHAVVIVDKNKPEVDGAARQVAEAIAQAVAGVTDATEFKQKAEAVAAGELQVKVESLTPVTADGRTADPARPPKPGEPPGSFDPAFAAAAASLKKAGEISPIVRSSFGYHIILLTERIEAKHSPAEERRQWFHDEVLRHRSQVALAAILEPAQQAAKMVITEQAPVLTGLVRVEQ